MYLSGCLRDRIPLQGKEMSDRLPAGISGGWGEGLTHSSVGSSSDSALGSSDHAGVDCGRLEISAGHDIGSVSTSRLSVKSTVPGLRVIPMGLPTPRVILRVGQGWR